MVRKTRRKCVPHRKNGRTVAPKKLDSAFVVDQRGIAIVPVVAHRRGASSVVAHTRGLSKVTRQQTKYAPGSCKSLAQHL